MDDLYKYKLPPFLQEKILRDLDLAEERTKEIVDSIIRQTERVCNNLPPRLKEPWYKDMSLVKKPLNL